MAQAVNGEEEIRKGDGPEFVGTPDHEAELQLRYEVLLRPVGIERWDHYDKDSLHVTAWSASGEIVGCVLFHAKDRPADGVATGQLLQMAVRAGGKGTGSRLFEALLEEVRRRGFGEITCHARHYAVGFYEKMGFVEFGDRFEEVGMEHALMRFVV